MKIIDGLDAGMNWDAVNAELQPRCERMMLNVQQTGHPFHHLTANGAIVDRDPRLNRDYLEEYHWLAGIPVSVPKLWARPKRAVHLDTEWYSKNAGKRWLKKHSTAGVVQAMPSQQPTLWG
jgi:hypothetical protein